MTTTLNEIIALKVEDRILLVQAIWDSIAAEQAYPELTDAQKQELDRRIEDTESNPENTFARETPTLSIDD
ncbi:addiction module protein [Calothrix sp. 336/3]